MGRSSTYPARTSGLLIGRRGQTLQALQFLVNIIVRQKMGESVRVMLDVERYRERRESSLRDMATKVAARVVQTNRSVTLEPMPPADRRVCIRRWPTTRESPPKAQGRGTTAR